MKSTEYDLHNQLIMIYLHENKRKNVISFF